MKNLEKILLILILTVSGISCKTIENIHTDLACDGIPDRPASQTLTHEERMLMGATDELKDISDKVLLRSGSLQNRIEKICKDIIKHNIIAKEDR